MATTTRLTTPRKKKISFAMDDTRRASSAQPPIHSPRRRSKGEPEITPVRPYGRHRSKHNSSGNSGRGGRSTEPLLLHFDEYVGWMSPWAWLWGTIFLSIPAAYVYIGLVLLRELCASVAAVDAFVAVYLPPLAGLVTRMQAHSSVWVEAWCILEAIFYIGLKIHMHWLQTRDTLEASLSAAPLMDGTARRVLWQRMMETEGADTAAWVQGWILEDDKELAHVSRVDMVGFLCWSMFDGRQWEHLTTAEGRQLESFLEELQVRISLQVYGAVTDDDVDEEEDESPSLSDSGDETVAADSHDSGYDPWKVPRLLDLAQPKKFFTFRKDVPHEEHSFFADLYETYRHRYEQMFSADFSPVQDLATRLTAPVQSLVSEGLHTAESSAHHVYESLVPTRVDESLAAVRHATYVQLTEAWNSVKNIRERLETARFLSQKRQALQQQLRGYRVMLHRMLENSHAAARMPSQQKAILMRRITECNEALEGLEKRAQSAFVQATGFARKNLAQLLPSREEPRRFATYSSDPLLGTATYPLGLHVLVLGGTEIPLRILMARRGFEKKRIGPVSYYYHPGTASPVDALDDALMQDDLSNSNHGVDDDPVPLVFVHGIGIGLIAYLPLVDALLKTGRPLFLPEIPYVSGFRPWQSPNAVLSPQVVTSTLSAMLASHGFLRATFAGHSYGTSWLSYMCKPDPGTMAYIVRTDVIVNWTIQRSFPWAWISLFTEQIKVPTTIFLSEKDMLVPAEKVEAYLVERQVPVCDYNKVTADYFESEAVVNACVFRGDGHGGWTERPGQTVPLIATAAEILCQRAIRKN